MTPDPRALVDPALNAALGLSQDGRDRVMALADALRSALDRIDALTAPVDDARVREIEELLARCRSRDDADGNAAWWELSRKAGEMLAYLLARVRALTAEVAGAHGHRIRGNKCSCGGGVVRYDEEA